MGSIPQRKTGLHAYLCLVDAYSQYIVSYRCLNVPGELPRLTKRAVEEIQSYGVIFKQISGDSAYASEGVTSVINTAYGEKRGAELAKGVPDEHETMVRVSSETEQPATWVLSIQKIQVINILVSIQ